MKTNINNVERALRVVVGLFLMSLTFWGPSNTWFILGIIPVITGLIGWCPLYTSLGVNTCRFNPQTKSKDLSLN